MDPAQFDRLSRFLSTRRGVVSGALGGLVSMASLAVAGPDAAAKSKACTRRHKRCGKRCIPKKACCLRTQRRCGKKCIPKRGCCNSVECGAFNLCVKHQCVTGRGTCSADGSPLSDYCVRGENSRCDAGGTNCGCFNTTFGARRCGRTTPLNLTTPCESDANCAFAFPNVPGAFCVDGMSGINCPYDQPLCYAPCPR